MSYDLKELPKKTQVRTARIPGSSSPEEHYVRPAAPCPGLRAD
jgi:hypothetical protein